ncbi:hypothetical protein [Sphingopyxis sp.]|jgi:hypothetical protein|uniref:hypothetical protein n=1 Tax=Sphingopyxis sp. TaxID=1908224 RepID=UPI002DE34065|nr:hypothetical protein [Sphingopyxis sp.]
MRRTIWAGAALLSLAPCAVGAASADPAPAAIAAPAARASDLDIATDFFMPRAPIEAFIREACSSSVRTRLTTVDEDIRIGREIPGIHDAMIARATDYCGVHIGPAIDNIQNRARSRVVAAFTPAEIALIAEHFGFAVDEVRAMKVAIRDGETAGTAAQRTLAETPIDTARFERAGQALARSPGGAALTGKIAAMQRMVGVEMQTQVRIIVKPLIADALTSARRAGNDHARSRGHAAVYAVD